MNEWKINKIIFVFLQKKKMMRLMKAWTKKTEMKIRMVIIFYIAFGNK